MSSDLLRGQARDYYESEAADARSDAGGRGLELAGVAGAALRASSPICGSDEPEASILDYGCGYGALADYLRARGHRGAYVGFDVSEAMAEAAHARVASLPACRVTAASSRICSRPTTRSPAACSTSSRTPPTTRGATYIWETVADLAALGTRGFAFNALTLYSDADKRRPGSVLRRPARARSIAASARYSRFVTLLHDYPLYEFTILVRR